MKPNGFQKIPSRRRTTVSDHFPSDWVGTRPLHGSRHCLAARGDFGGGLGDGVLAAHSRYSCRFTCEAKKGAEIPVPRNSQEHFSWWKCHDGESDFPVPGIPNLIPTPPTGMLEDDKL